jgi:uncharacterized RDD family membrane protein YckC
MQAAPPAAPRFRRILAWIVDVVVATVLSMVTVGFFGIFAPPETARVMVPLLLGGLAVSMVYFGYAAPLFGNSVGKALFGLRVISDHGERLNFWEWTARLLVNAIWPINAIVMLASDGGRHLGDRAAGTRVVLERPERSFWLALVAAVVVVVGGFELAVPAMKLGMVNSSACKTARAFLAESRPGERVSLLPAALQLVDDQALLDYRVGNDWARVLLERDHDGSWQVKRAAKLEEPGSGISISFSPRSSSGD